uniref:Methyltransferase-related protein n=1 Tax=Salix viminalis TaxID=40686 RepID=A0A6N2LII1_SALVM
MCPLRLILIFLSATLAGFFVIKNLKSSPFSATSDTIDDDSTTTDSNRSSPHASDYYSSSRFSKVKSGVEMGFWTLVDMASGKYLWRQLGFSSKRES